MTEKIKQMGVQTHMCEFPVNFFKDVPLTKFAGCKKKNCIHSERFLDTFDCLFCDFLVLGSITDELIETYLAAFEKHEENIGAWPSVAKAADRLREIKRSRK